MITFKATFVHRNEEVPTICSHGTVVYAIHAFCKSENQNCVPAKGSDKLRSHAPAWAYGTRGPGELNSYCGMWGILFFMG